LSKNLTIPGKESNFIVVSCFGLYELEYHILTTLFLPLPTFQHFWNSVIACYDQHTQTWWEFDCGAGYYCMETVYATTAAGDYLMNLIFNSYHKQSKL